MYGFHYTHWSCSSIPLPSSDLTGGKSEIDKVNIWKWHFNDKTGEGLLRPHLPACQWRELRAGGSAPSCYKCDKCLAERAGDLPKVKLPEAQIFWLFLVLFLVPSRILLNPVTFVLLACEHGLQDCRPALEPLFSTVKGNICLSTFWWKPNEAGSVPVLCGCNTTDIGILLLRP